MSKIKRHPDLRKVKQEFICLKSDCFDESILPKYVFRFPKEPSIDPVARMLKRKTGANIVCQYFGSQKQNKTAHEAYLLTLTWSHTETVARLLIAVPANWIAFIKE